MRDDHQAGALGELGGQHDDQDQAGEDRADGVDGPRPVDAPPRAAGSRSTASARFQCRTMPAWQQREGGEHTEDVELDQAGDGAFERHRSAAPATTASRMMPLENASRSPRVCSWRGR